MEFKVKYPIIQKLITSGTKRRSGAHIAKVKFVVAHDTGNPTSTARGNVQYYENTNNEDSASAHLFVDDKEIIECIPVFSGPAEKAWHVLYNVTTDNRLYGANANDAAIGVEYCYGGNINADEAYNRYIWVLAYVCHLFELDPATSIVGHFFLDPQRKTDPVTGLAKSRRTYDQLLKDVVTEYNECIGHPLAEPIFQPEAGEAISTVKLNIRKGMPNAKVEIVRTVLSGTKLKYIGWVRDGQTVNGNSKWFKDEEGNFFWSGGVAV